jgi:hypothetical protein
MQQSQPFKFNKNTQELDKRKDKHKSDKSEMSMSSVKSLKSKDNNYNNQTRENNQSKHSNNTNTNNNNIQDQNDDCNMERSTHSKHSAPQSDIIVEELPLNDENLKFEIMKEFKRIYGNNLHRLFLKENLSKSSNTLELIIRNLKVAKSKMNKMGMQMQKDPDDLLVSCILLLFDLTFLLLIFLLLLLLD